MTEASPATVLVVDDDPHITALYAEVLRSHSYDVLTAGSCADAMAKMDAARGKPRVLVVDFGLPDGDGGDFVRGAVAKYGARPTLYVSGWTDEFWQLEDLPGPWLIMRKPIPVPKFLAGIRWLLEGGEKPPELAEG